MFAEARFEPAFAAVQGLEITLPPERRVQLAALAKPGLSMAEYRALDLPVVIGNLGAEQKTALAPNARLGFFLRPPVSHLVSLSGRNEDEVALQLVTDLPPDQPRTLILKDAFGDELASQPNGSPLMMGIRSRLRQQRGLVADILRFDRQTFGTGAASVSFDFDQDRPSAHHVKAPVWHVDRGFASERTDDALTRVYLVRYAASAESLRDRLAYDEAGQPTSLLEGIRRKHEAAPNVYAAWLAQVKAAGMFFQAPAACVTLMTTRTWHKSHRPQQALADSHLRLAVRPLRELRLL